MLNCTTGTWDVMCSGNISECINFLGPSYINQSDKSFPHSISHRVMTDVPVIYNAKKAHKSIQMVIVIMILCCLVGFDSEDFLFTQTCDYNYGNVIIIVVNIIADITIIIIVFTIVCIIVIIIMNISALNNWVCEVKEMNEWIIESSSQRPPQPSCHLANHLTK